MLRYLVDAKRPLSIGSESGDQWDIFISAYNDSERVRHIFENVKATDKCWWMLPEYGYSSAELPTNAKVVQTQNWNEAELVVSCMKDTGLDQPTSARICIDITGFMRPHILFLLKYLKANGIREFDMIYSEPEHYSRKADTAFSLDENADVRQVAGFEGLHSTDMSGDVLIVGVGYDHNLIAQVMANKESARFVQLHSLPSLSADMYHESILRLDRVASASTHLSSEQVFFSSANDPFVTASTLAEAVMKISARQRITNLYLSPLATKPQALGFGLFYLHELEGAPASIIFPYSTKYSRETSKGLGRSWIYPVAL